MKLDRSLAALFAASLAATACGSKDKGDKAPAAAPAAEPAKVDDQTVVPDAGPANADATAAVVSQEIKSDGEALGLRSGDEMVANMLAGARLATQDLTPEAREELARLSPTLPKAGGGIQTFTAGHLTNGVKIAYRVCDAWMKHAADGKDDRFATNLPWKDGGAADKFLVLSQFMPVFEEAFWGPDKANYPNDGDTQAIMMSFNDSLQADYTNPDTQEVTGVKFVDSVTANCVVVALASPSWFK